MADKITYWIVLITQIIILSISYNNKWITYDTYMIAMVILNTPFLNHLCKGTFKNE